jgi:hypothetical protein
MVAENLSTYASRLVTRLGSSDVEILGGTSIGVCGACWKFVDKLFQGLLALEVAKQMKKPPRAVVLIGSPLHISELSPKLDGGMRLAMSLPRFFLESTLEGKHVQGQCSSRDVSSSERSYRSFLESLRWGACGSGPCATH